MEAFRWETLTDLGEVPKLVFTKHQSIQAIYDSLPERSPVRIGATGSTGPIGSTGLMGAPGYVGETGGIGGIGGNGLIGEQGYGATGATGPTGPTGPSGPTSYCLPQNTRINVEVRDGKYCFQNGDAHMYGVTMGDYLFNIPEEHPIAFLPTGNDLQNMGYGFTGNMIQPRIQAPDGTYPIYYYGNIKLSVYYYLINKIGYCCLYHGYEGGKDNIRFSTFCNIGNGGETGTGTGPTYTLQDAYIKYVNNVYVITDSNGTPITQYPGSTSTQNVIYTGSNFNYIVYFDPIGDASFYFKILGLIANQAGKFKIKQTQTDTYPTYYYILCDDTGVEIQDQRYPDRLLNLLIYWDGNAVFPLVDVYAHEVYSGNAQITQYTYTIEGLFNTISTLNYKIKQPLPGVYANSNYYDLVTITSEPVLDAGDQNSIQTVIINWDSGTDTFPSQKYPTSGYTTIGYTIIGYYSYVTSGNYKIKQITTGSNILELVNFNGIAVNDPGYINNTVKILYDHTTDTFPIQRISNSGYKTIQYNIVGIYTENAIGTYYLKQKVVNNLPSETLYTLVNFDGTDYLLEGTVVTVEWNNTGGFPRLFNSTINTTILYVIAGVSILVKGDYKLIPTTNQNEYSVVDFEGIAINDFGTNNTTKVLVSFSQTLSFPILKTSTSNYISFKYSIIGLFNIPSVVIVSGPTGPTGESGPINANYDFGTLFPTYTYSAPIGPTGPYDGIDKVNSTTNPTGATGPEVTNTTTGKVITITAQHNSMHILSTQQDWFNLFSA